MRLLAVSLWLLNLFDALATWYAVTVEGYAAEANPSMAGLLARSPVCFFLVKLGLMTACCALLLYTSRRKPRLAYGTLIAATALYGLVACWHVYGFLFWR